MTEKPGFPSYDRQTALPSDVIVIRRQVLIEGTVRFTFPRRDRTSVFIDRAKAVTLFPSYYKTTLSIGLVTGFEPPTYRSYATICSLSFVNFRGSFMVYDGKTTYIFFSLIKRCLFFFQ